MGMAAPDVVLFIVGALLFGGAVTALMVQGGPAALGGTGGSATGIYTVDYETKTVDAAKEAVSDFSVQHKATLNMTTLNVTSIKVVIQCTDPASNVPNAEFNIQVQVQPPGGIAAPKPTFGICGQKIEIPIPVAALPPKTTVTGSSPADAAAHVPHDTNESAAAGTWVVTTSGGRAGGQLPVGIPAGNPGGTILLQADQWDSKITAVPK